MKTEEGIAIFNVSERSFSVYKDTNDAAGAVGMPLSTFKYNLSDDHVYYHDPYFIGKCIIHRSNRGKK